MIMKKFWNGLTYSRSLALLTIVGGLFLSAMETVTKRSEASEARPAFNNSHKSSSLGLGIAGVSIVNEKYLWAVANETRQVTSDPQKLYLNDQGVVLHSSDGGLSWKKLWIAPEEFFFDVYFVNYRVGWIAGGDGLILKSTDGGESWTRQDVPTHGHLLDIEFTDSYSGWTVSSNGEALHTKDGGLNWVSHKTGSQYGLPFLSFGDRYSGWVVGERGEAYNSTDGGVTWQSSGSELVKILKARQKDDLDFREVKFFNSTTGFIAVDISSINSDTSTHMGAVLKTQDGGKTWKTILVMTELGIRTAHFTNESDVWVVPGGRANNHLLHTRNGGENWERVPLPKGSSVRSLYFADSRHGWFILDEHQYSNKIFRTVDGGATWAKVSLQVKRKIQ